MPEDEGVFVCQVSEDGGPFFPLVAGCVIVRGQLKNNVHVVCQATCTCTYRPLSPASGI